MAARHAAVATSDASPMGYSKSGEDWSQKLCHSGMQSPIDIEPDQVQKSSMQVRVLYRPWEPEDVDISDTFGGVPKLVFKEGKSPGRVLVGSEYGDFDEYTLSSVQVHAPSEHTFRHANWPVEVQLWHKPQPLLRISKLGKSMVELGETSKKVDEQLKSMAEAEEQLRLELKGVTSPWEKAVGKTGVESVQQTLDWMDASKKDIEDQAIALSRDTLDQVKKAGELAVEVDSIVAAQAREFAMHHVVISLFIQRTPGSATGGNTSYSNIVEWFAKALSHSRHADGTLDVKSMLTESAGGSYNTLIAYNGSLNRPPCTPNVRWFVSARPLPARAEHIEDLIRATLLHSQTGTFLDDSIIGDAREVQPSAGRSLKHVTVYGTEFEEPIIVPLDMMSEDARKWDRVSRYTKLFFMCAFAILCTPSLFAVMRACGSDVETPAPDEKAE